jgi:hypothetical protein
MYYIRRNAGEKRKQSSKKALHDISFSGLIQGSFCTWQCHGEDSITVCVVLPKVFLLLLNDFIYTYTTTTTTTTFTTTTTTL